MMDVYIVWVGVACAGRWIDSIFIERATADARVEQLKSSFRSSGHTTDIKSYWPWVMTAKIEDAALAPPETTKTTDPKGKKAK